MSLLVMRACARLVTGKLPGLTALAWMALAVPAHAADPEPLVVATYAYPQRDRAAAIRPLADYLGGQLKRPVEVRVLASPTALIAGMAAGEVDVAVPNLHGYLQALKLPAGSVATLPVPAVPPAQAERYRAVIVARLPLTGQTLAAEAARLRLVLVGPDSASGGFVPRGHLGDLGIARPEAAFASVDHAGSHAASLAWLREGRAEVAALAADVYDAEPHAGLHEIWRSPVIPPGPLLCRPAADVDCAAIRDELLAVEPRDPAVMAGLRMGWPEFGDATGLTGADEAALAKLAERID
nr:PhnD/SsuA/transferrin family substrate-binding protein [Pseudoxanthomonas sp.]